jgi:3-dehydroquinate synthase
MEVTSTIYTKIPVGLKDREYELILGKNLASEIKSVMDCLVGEGQQIVVFVDAAIADHYAMWMEEVFSSFPLCILNGGESTKSFERYQYCCEFLAKHRIGRKAALICIGGGVVGDLVGFVAATYCRGIDYYLIPTTLLSMVDSSIGGKTAIDLPQGKNLVGAFHQPRRVFIDLKFLEMLPRREFNAGMAEVIKYALIGDPEMFEQLLRRPAVTVDQVDFLYKIIERSCKIKARIVQVDEKESDQVQQRFRLNYGHTFGHAIEKAMHYECLHGEAVGLGMLLAGAVCGGFRLAGRGDCRCGSTFVGAL